MEDRTWHLFTKAACNRDQRVTQQVASEEAFGTRTQPFPRLELALDDGDCSCHPRRHARAQTAA